MKIICFSVGFRVTKGNYGFDRVGVVDDVQAESLFGGRLGLSTQERILPR